MDYQPATLAQVEGFAVARLETASAKPPKIVGTFRTRHSLTAAMIASEGNIVYSGLAEINGTLHHVEVPVVVRSYGKVAEFRSCGMPRVRQVVKSRHAAPIPLRMR